MKSLVGPRSSSDSSYPVLQGRAKHEMSELEIEQPWDAHESIGLEVKELREQVTDGLGIYLASG